MIHRSVLQLTRGERVPLLLYERTFFSVLHFHFMTAFQTRPKRRRVFPFPNNHRRPSKVLTMFLLTFFPTFSIRPSIFFSCSYNAFPHFFFYFSYTAEHSPTSSRPDRSQMPPVSVSESDKKILTKTKFQSKM